jgi:hypothetical protein
MTEDLQQNQAQPSDKEINFRKQEAMYQRMLDERERRIQELEQERQAARAPKEEEDEDDSEPYVDHKKLNRKLAKVGQSTQSEIQKAMQEAKLSAKEELRQEMWLENNPDFFDVLKLADKFAQQAPKLADNILKMPEGFERQKLVYNTIKQMGMDKPQEKQSSVQDKINANRQSPYYQPSGVGSAPHNATAGDFSDAGKKAAYDKVQALKAQFGIQR